MTIDYFQMGLKVGHFEAFTIHEIDVHCTSSQGIDESTERHFLVCTLRPRCNWHGPIIENDKMTIERYCGQSECMHGLKR